MQDRLTLKKENVWDAWDWPAMHAGCLREARRLLHSEQDAQEVAQDALLRAWRHRGRQQTSGSELWWARRIARNEALRRLARQTRRQDVYTDAPMDQLVDPSVDQDVMELAEIIDLREAIAELTPMDALLLRLRYERDLTQPRLARLAGLPEGTVKIRLHRIRARLRERLTETNG
jgi:RNA polymerase sigma-70 factor (ECF subfamily)